MTVGDVIQFPLFDDDKLKYCVIVGVSGDRIGVIPINTQPKNLITENDHACIHKITVSDYPEILKYDSWADSREVFEIKEIYLHIATETGVKMNKHDARMVINKALLSDNMTKIKQKSCGIIE